LLVFGNAGLNAHLVTLKQSVLSTRPRVGLKHSGRLLYDFRRNWSRPFDFSRTKKNKSSTWGSYKKSQHGKRKHFPYEQ